VPTTRAMKSSPGPEVRSAVTPRRQGLPARSPHHPRVHRAAAGAAEAAAGAGAGAGPAAGPAAGLAAGPVAACEAGSEACSATSRGAAPPTDEASGGLDCMMQ
jgi:hypothetical protein